MTVCIILVGKRSILWVGNGLQIATCIVPIGRHSSTEVAGGGEVAVGVCECNCATNRIAYLTQKASGRVGEGEAAVDRICDCSEQVVLVGECSSPPLASTI